MLIESHDGEAERRVLISVIVSTEFLARTAGKLGKDPLRSSWSNLIWKWCDDYYKKYHKAPGENIRSLFSTWAKTSSDKATHENVSRLLGSLSGQYEKEEDLGYSLDLAEQHFNDVLIERLQEALQQRRERGQTGLALTDLEGFRRVNLHVPISVNILEDEQAQRSALEDKQRVLIQYPGAAGEFFGSELAEDSFIAVMAQAKGGKSYTLLDMAWHAMRQGRQVAYFQVGDLSQNQIMRRFLKRAVYRPMHPQIVKYPVGIILPEGHRELAVVDYVDRVFENDISWDTARKAFQRIAAKNKGRIRLSKHTVKTVSAMDILGILDSWDRSGWRSDVVVIDYAGNLGAINGSDLLYEQTNQNWARMKQISEARCCLVITANQSNTKGFTAWVLTRQHFGDSRMILAHVTSFLGVNMTDEEKDREIVRYNWVVRREEKFSETQCLYAASCLSVANPIVCSVLPR